MDKLIQFEDDFYNDFEKRISKVNSKAFDLIKEMILSEDYTLNNLESKIREILVRAGYGKTVDSLLNALQYVSTMTTEYYQKRELTNIFSESKSANFFIEVLTDNLKGAGINEIYIKKISNTIRQETFNGLPNKNLFNSVAKIASDGGVLPRYVNTITTDTIGQYSGILQQEIKNKLNPTKGRWIGKTIATTRPICRHLTKQQERLGFVSVDYLKATLKVYVPNGVPDTELGSGIIEGTTIDNFEKNRGGYNCRHKWIWIL